jgi:tetratricopeptide (TPR) repeat protein
MVRRDWAAARAELLALKSSPEMQNPAARVLGRWFSLQLATADAGLGDFKAAHMLTDGMALDCYDCLRVRGQIAAFEHRWDAANDWFAKAVHAGPSIPFANLEWGRMLMAKGDLDGAIAKFESAHAKGPHFADPLEMWGEALIAKNRSDLALEKFEEANRYAPNWKRLHQKWGEALSYVGRKDEAAKQMALAKGLSG